MNFKAPLIALAILASSHPAVAQEQTDQELKEQLLRAGKKNRTRGIVIKPKDTRNIVLEDTKETRPLYGTPPPPPPPAVQAKPIENAESVTVPTETVSFEFNSYQLLPVSFGRLTQYSRVMQDPDLSGLVFRIEGHTDAIGSDAYNLKLSHQRAQSVKAYLLATGISENRIIVIGLGELQPKNPADPNAAVNRRVEIIPIPLQQ